MKITMKNKKSDGFDELYPETLAENVNFLNGLNLEQYKNEVENRIPDDVPLWEGNERMAEGVKIKPSKKLSECRIGWILRWQSYYDDQAQNNNFGYTHVPKIHLLSSGTGFKDILGSQGNRIVSKYVYVRDYEIEGHDLNVNDTEEENGRLTLTAVFEY